MSWSRRERRRCYKMPQVVVIDICICIISFTGFRVLKQPYFKGDLRKCLLHISTLIHTAGPIHLFSWISLRWPVGFGMDLQFWKPSILRKYFIIGNDVNYDKSFHSFQRDFKKLFHSYNNSTRHCVILQFSKEEVFGKRYRMCRMF